MWCWLNANAGAIQGISAALAVILTLALVVVTCWYVRLTNQLAANAQRQFELSQQQFRLAQKQFYAAYLPHLRLEIHTADAMTNHHIGYFCKNIGQQTLRLQSLAIRVIDEQELFVWTDPDVGTLLLSPHRQDKEFGTVEIPPNIWTYFSNKSLLDFTNSLWIEAVLSDVAGLVTYRCTNNQVTGYKVTVVDN